jgi:hypothetical protein
MTIVQLANCRFIAAHDSIDQCRIIARAVRASER